MCRAGAGPRCTLPPRCSTRAAASTCNVVVRDQNPRPGGCFVTDEIATPRELAFSTFMAWRPGLLVGFLHSVGVPKKIAGKHGESGGGTALPAASDAPSPPLPPT